MSNIPKIIISLTSFPARINTVNKTIETLLNQTKQADEIVLWLCLEEFPNKDSDLPQILLNLKDKYNIFKIKYCDKNIKSYKKLIPSLKEYPDDVIITADDDILYENNRVELLYNSFMENKEYKNIVHCHRARKIGFYNNHEMYSYKLWQIIEDQTISYNNFLTGAGMVLYPPHIFDEVIIDENIFMKICPSADDIWFWANCVRNNVKIKVVKNNITRLMYVYGTQDVGLYHHNCKTDLFSLTPNDYQIKEVIEMYPDILNKLEKIKPTKLCDKKKYYLFGLPIWTIKTKNNKKKYYLFNFLPILTIKRK